MSKDYADMPVSEKSFSVLIEELIDENPEAHPTALAFLQQAMDAQQAHEQGQKDWGEKR